MKKLVLLFIAAILSPVTLAADFTEGTHFKVVSKAPVTAQPEITEYFSFLCGGCFRYEPLVKELKDKLPKGIKFNKSHVEFLGGSVGKDLSRAHAVASLLNIEATINPKIFNAVHIDRKRFTGLQDIRQIFIDNGIDGKQFDGAAESFMVDGRVSTMAQNATKFSIMKVPTFIVNGKYQIITDSLESAEQFQALTRFLANKKG